MWSAQNTWPLNNGRLRQASRQCRSTSASKAGVNGGIGRTVRTTRSGATSRTDHSADRGEVLRDFCGNDAQLADCGAVQHGPIVQQVPPLVHGDVLQRIAWLQRERPLPMVG